MKLVSTDEHYAGWEIYQDSFGGWSADCVYASKHIWAWNKEELYFEIDTMNENDIHFTS